MRQIGARSSALADLVSILCTRILGQRPAGKGPAAGAPAAGPVFTPATGRSRRSARARGRRSRRPPRHAPPRRRRISPPRRRCWRRLRVRLFSRTVAGSRSLRVCRSAMKSSGASKRAAEPDRLRCVRGVGAGRADHDAVAHRAALRHRDPADAAGGHHPVGRLLLLQLDREAVVPTLPMRSVTAPERGLAVDLGQHDRRRGEGLAEA